MEIKVKAYGKINLALDIINKRPDGYHNIKSVMQTIALHDNIFLREISQGVRIKTNSQQIPADRNNLAYLAAELFFKETGIKNGVEIYIEKNIPIAAGLAGGSADAAAVLTGLNQLFNVNMKDNKLREIGLMIGADVPFCLMGGTVLAEGIGEILTPLNRLRDLFIVLVVPEIKVSTKWAYENYSIQEGNRDFAPLLVSIKNNCNKTLFNNMFNVFQGLLETEFPVISDIRRELGENGGRGVLMSGSGPTVFGFFENGDEAKQACKIINPKYGRVFFSKLV